MRCRSASLRGSSAALSRRPAAAALLQPVQQPHRRALASLSEVAAKAEWGGPSKPRVVYAVEGHVGTIFLNNPAKHNALDLRGYLELPAAAEAVSKHSAVRVVVLQGHGETTAGLPMSFGAGSDISEFPELRMGTDAIARYLHICTTRTTDPLFAPAAQFPAIDRADSFGTDWHAAVSSAIV